MVAWWIVYLKAEASWKLCHSCSHFTYSRPFIVPQPSQREILMLSSDAQDAKLLKGVCISIHQCLHTQTRTLSPSSLKNRISPVYMQQNNTKIRKQNSAQRFIFRESQFWYSGFPYQHPHFNRKFNEGRTHYTVQRDGSGTLFQLQIKKSQLNCL